MKNLMKYAGVLSALIVVVSNSFGFCLGLTEEPVAPKGLIK
ncbi:MAG: hypothetical protein N4A47_06310 [Clostridia bacterium]|jgi:cyclic lactone autoinducer peptide|nr:hypothetical protein [Clostridia bacterium]